MLPCYGRFANASRSPLRRLLAATTTPSQQRAVFFVRHQHTSLTSITRHCRQTTTSAPRVFHARALSTEADAKTEDGETEEETHEEGDTEEAGEKHGHADAKTGMHEMDPKDQEIHDLKEALTAEKDKNKEMHDKVLRTLADIENTRKVAKNDVDNARKFGVQGFAKSLLEVADTLEMALKAAKDELDKGDHDGLKSFYEGVDMTETIFQKAMGKHGVMRFESEGDKFDPNIHDGLFQYEDPEKEPNSVGQVMKKGYMIGDRCLRPAQLGTIKGSTK
jgi:molecular chaperone GrpE